MRFLHRFALAMALLAMPATGAVAETPVERGRYLVTTIAACGNCHTPRDATKKPVAGRELSGGFEFEDPGLGQVAGTNITPDAETGIGQWSEAEIVTALRDGKRVTTVEGLARNGKLSKLQQAFLDCGGAQCGAVEDVVLGDLDLRQPESPHGFEQDDDSGDDRRRAVGV